MKHFGFSTKIITATITAKFTANFNIASEHSIIANADLPSKNFIVSERASRERLLSDSVVINELNFNIQTLLDCHPSFSG